MNCLVYFKGYSSVPVLSCIISNSWSASKLTSSKLMSGLFLNLVNKQVIRRKHSSQKAYIRSREGWDSSSPPIIMMPLSLIFPVKLLSTKGRKKMHQVSWAKQDKNKIGLRNFKEQLFVAVTFDKLIKNNVFFKKNMTNIQNK